MNHLKENPSAENKPLQESILKTLKFFDQFQFPLTFEELLEYLYKRSGAIHIKGLKGILEQMEALGEIEQVKGYVILAGHTEWIEKRKTRAFISERLWHRAKFYTQHLLKIPFVRMVAVCNSLAYNNAREDSDIDLFIVIEKGHMWFTRLIITLTLHFFGVRRHGNKTAGRFCLSFFVTPSKLEMGKIALKGEDPYLAYWVKMLSPLYGKKMYEEFKGKNEHFLKDYGLKFSEESMKHFYDEPRESGLKLLLEKIFGGFLGRGAEWILKKTYKNKTNRKKEELGPEASVVVSDDMLKFHNEDRRVEYRGKMELQKN